MGSADGQLGSAKDWLRSIKNGRDQRINQEMGSEFENPIRDRDWSI